MAAIPALRRNVDINSTIGFTELPLADGTRARVTLGPVGNQWSGVGVCLRGNLAVVLRYSSMEDSGSQKNDGCLEMLTEIADLITTLVVEGLPPLVLPETRVLIF